jgi:hypothetical protein
MTIGGVKVGGSSAGGSPRTSSGNQARLMSYFIIAMILIVPFAVAQVVRSRRRAWAKGRSLSPFVRSDGPSASEDSPSLTGSVIVGELTIATYTVKLEIGSQALRISGPLVGEPLLAQRNDVSDVSISRSKGRTRVEFRATGGAESSVAFITLDSDARKKFAAQGWPVRPA